MGVRKKSLPVTSESKPIPATSAVDAEWKLPIPEDNWNRMRWVHYSVVGFWSLVVVLVFISFFV